MVMACWVLAGCASPKSPQFDVAAGQYAGAFDATREVLRSYRFDLERVDAAVGVITTAQKTSAGLATPWDGEQSSFSQEVDDLLNQQTRSVRVTFRPASLGGAEAAVNRPVDPAESMVGRVEVIIYRTQTPGLRPSSRAITMTSLTLDPAATAQGVGGQYVVPMTQDSRFAARLAREIAERIGADAAAAETGSEPATRRVARP